MENDGARNQRPRVRSLMIRVKGTYEKRALTDVRFNVEMKVFPMEKICKRSPFAFGRTMDF